MKWNLRVPSKALLALCVFVGFSATTFAQVVPDPAVPGPYAVSREEYDFGTSVFIPQTFAILPPLPPVTTIGETEPRFPVVEVTASVHYPSNLSAGPFPLIVFMHGRHSTAYDPTTESAFLQWPPQAGRRTIPSFKGYDYCSQVLASHGYVVVSVSANGINARDNDTLDRGMLARGELIQRHLDLWRTFSTVGGAPFGDQFVGTIDLNNVGTMGHSRGGEGVVRHYLVNQALGAPYTIKAVLPLAPVDFNRPVINDVPLFVLLPYCDGDVTDLQGAHFFDDARYNLPGDNAPKYLMTVMGANHNFYNTYWTRSDDEPDPQFSFNPGSSDDWMGAPTSTSATSLQRRLDPFASTSVPGNKRLTPAQQRGTALAYFIAFFRVFNGNETVFEPLLKGSAPPPASAQPPPFPARDYLHFAYHAPETAQTRLDVNRLLAEDNLSINTLGGQVEHEGLAPYDVCGGEPPQPLHCLVNQPNARQPHTTPSLNGNGKRGLSQLRLGWNSPSAYWRNELPAGAGDIRGFVALQFRASVNFQDPRNTQIGIENDFTVVLTDGAGRTAATPVSAWSPALFFPPGKIISIPKVLLHAIRIPLAEAFTGIDLADVRTITFRFDRRPRGALLVSDIAFVDPTPRQTPRTKLGWEVAAHFAGGPSLALAGGDLLGWLDGNTMVQPLSVGGVSVVSYGKEVQP